MGKHLGTQKSIRFSEDELEVLEQLKDRHGSYKAAIMASLRRELGANQPTNKELIEMLKARLG